jgi:hypothetical protein
MSKINEANDHEVAMAHASLKAIIDAATQLQGKIGSMEINLPGWIQDHITNSENYINQANKGFHKLDEAEGFEDDVVITNPNNNPNVLTYGLWSLKNVGTSNVQVPTPDPNFDRDQLAYQASASGMSREEWIAHYGSASHGDGSGAAG